MEADAATMTSYVIGVLQSYGLAGLVMGAMGWIIRALWQDNIYLRNTLFDTGNKAVEANAAMSSALTQLRTDVLTASRNGRGD